MRGSARRRRLCLAAALLLAGAAAASVVGAQPQGAGGAAAHDANTASPAATRSGGGAAIRASASAAATAGPAGDTPDASAATGGGGTGGVAAGGGGAGGAAGPAASSTAAAGGGAAQPGDSITASCVEQIPKGATRPGLEVSFPGRGLSGHAARLRVVISHGPGETVLPEGLRVSRSTDAARAIEAAGFILPDPDGGAGPTLEVFEPDEKQSEVKTALTIAVVPLPQEPGRHTLTLPPIPIAIARANGEVMTLCTKPQSIVVDDPIANEADPKVKGNPPPRRQWEAWAFMQHLTRTVAGAIVLAILLTLLTRWWLARPKVVPPKPPELPWVVALRELAAIRAGDLLDRSLHDEHFDQVDHCVRKYLGDRYGFDGVESTTGEIRALLKRVYPPPSQLEAIFELLGDNDLIKFTEATPSTEDCHRSLNEAERLVRATMPPNPETARPPAARPRGVRRAA